MVSLNGSSALVWDAERLRIASDAAGIALWSWNVDTDEIALDQRAHDLWVVPKVATPVRPSGASSRSTWAAISRVSSSMRSPISLAARAVPTALATFVELGGVLGWRTGR